MKQEPRIAIILPVFRNHLLLKEAVQSIINQSVAENFPMELVMIDDGSNDNGRTWSRIQDLERQIKTERSSIDVITVKRVRNDGPSWARIIGVSNSTAPWICYLDADDLMHRDRIKNAWRHISEFAAEKTGLILSQYKITHPKAEVPDAVINPEALTEGEVPHQVAQLVCLSDSLGILHSREAYNKMGGWPPFLLAWEDAVFVRRMLRITEVEFSDKIAGLKRVYSQGQRQCERRFDSGLYIKIDQEHENGPFGQYLDNASLGSHFIDTTDDPEYQRRNLSVYTRSLINPNSQ